MLKDVPYCVLIHLPNFEQDILLSKKVILHGKINI